MATTVTLDDLMKEMKALRKDMRKIRAHIEDPTGEKSKARAVNNGFNKPLDVTPELRAFLSLAADEKISRSQVTSRINTYVTAKGLRAGQNISMDAALQELLKPPTDMQVTFLNIQKYINPHYIKEEKPVAPKTPRAPKAEADPNAPPKEKKVRPKVAKPATTA